MKQGQIRAVAKIKPGDEINVNYSSSMSMKNLQTRSSLSHAFTIPESKNLHFFHKIPPLATQQWLWRRPLQPLWIAQWTILNFKWPHSLSSSLSKWLLYRYSLHQMNIFLMARLQCLRPGQYFFITKGQEISEGNWCLQFSPKNNKNIYFPNFCSSI